MEVSVLTLISVPEGRVCCALALNAVRPANNVAKSMRFIMVCLPVASKIGMHCINCELRLSHGQSWNSRDAGWELLLVSEPATLGFSRSTLFGTHTF
jgi:hypothetical protein